MKNLIRSISGIRGVVGAALIPETVIPHASAFAKWCDGGPIVLGFDGRPHGRLFADLVRATLQSSGADVLDLGMVPTPTVQLHTEHSAARGGIAITASHNPAEWNGLKFLTAEGVFLDAEQNTELFSLADAGSRRETSWKTLGRAETVSDAVDAHIERVLGIPFVDLPAIRARQLSVAVDSVNASGSVAVPMLLERMGCEVIRIACDGSGVFPHMPEPLPENLVSLGEAVRSYGADLGIAVDPDADRIVLFNELGQPFGEEYSITTAVYAVLSALGEGTEARVAVNLSTTRAVDDVAAMFGAEVLRSPVGEINVVRRMKQHDAVVGGEGSGGVILPSVHAGRDSLVGAALVLHALARHGETASSFRGMLPDYVIRKFRYSTEGLDTSAVLARAADRFHGERINTDDGVRIDFEEGWVHLRSSNTEPIMRVIAEAKDADAAGRLAAQVAAEAFGADTIAL